MCVYLYIIHNQIVLPEYIQSRLTVKYFKTINFVSLCASAWSFYCTIKGKETCGVAVVLLPDSETVDS
jgi:hypothetical protein